DRFSGERGSPDRAIARWCAKGRVDRRGDGHEGRRDRAAGAVRVQAAGRFGRWPCGWLSHGDWRTYGVPAAFSLRGHRDAGGDVRPDSAAACRELRLAET